MELASPPAMAFGHHWPGTPAVFGLGIGSDGEDWLVRRSLRLLVQRLGWMVLFDGPLGYSD
jgi:hypothetical protein